MIDVRETLRIALDKPLPITDEYIGVNEFNPWGDVIEGVFGGYASDSDELMIGALKAVRDKSTFDFIKASGFAGEFALYVLAGHGLLEYGTSPRGGWPDPDVEDMWDELIKKWESYAQIVWGTDD